MKQMKRNIELSFTSNEIDIISEALTTVSGAPAIGVPALLKRFDEVTGEHGAGSFDVTGEEMDEYEQSGKRSYKMRRHLNRKRYIAASGQVDTRAKEWEQMFSGMGCGKHE